MIFGGNPLQKLKIILAILLGEYYFSIKVDKFSCSVVQYNIPRGLVSYAVN